MATVDTSIYGRVSKGGNLSDLVNAYDQGVEAKQLSKARELKIKGVELEQAKQAKLSDLTKQYFKNGKLDRAGFSQGLAESNLGTEIPTYEKQWGEADKASAEGRIKQLEAGKKQIDFFRQEMGSLLAQPEITDQALAQAMVSAVRAGYITPEEGAEHMRTLPPDQASRRALLQQNMVATMDAAKQLEALLPKVQAQNLGGTTQLVDINPLTNPSVVGQQFQRTASPESVLSASTAVRGQDMTDARARDLNATKVEENKLKREAKEGADQQAKASQLASFDTMLGTLDRLSNHAGLARSVGVYGALPTMPGSDSANFQAELETFKSQAFIPMVAQLKGMGALSDAEGKKLSAAVGALDPKMGEKAFRESIGRIIADMQAARDRMAGGTKQASQAAQSASGGVLSPQQSSGNPYASSLQKRIDAGLMTKEQANAFLQSKGLKPEFGNDDPRTGSW